MRLPRIRCAKCDKIITSTMIESASWENTLRITVFCHGVKDAMTIPLNDAHEINGREGIAFQVRSDPA